MMVAGATLYPMATLAVFVQVESLVPYVYLRRASSVPVPPLEELKDSLDEGELDWKVEVGS